MPPASEPSGETSAPPVDLSAIAEKYRVNEQVMVLDMARFDPSNLTLLETLDMCEAAGVDTSELPSLLGHVGGSRLTGKAARLLYAFGWILARRADPSLSWEKVQTWRMQITGSMDPAAIERNRKRAIATINAAAALGTSPREAEKATIGEIAAAKQARKRVRRR